MNTQPNFLWIGMGNGLGAIPHFLIFALGKKGAFPYQTLFINN